MNENDKNNRPRPVLESMLNSKPTKGMLRVYIWLFFLLVIFVIFAFRFNSMSKTATTNKGYKGLDLADFKEDLVVKPEGANINNPNIPPSENEDSNKPNAEVKGVKPVPEQENDSELSTPLPPASPEDNNAIEAKNMPEKKAPPINPEDKDENSDLFIKESLKKELKFEGRLNHFKDPLTQVLHDATFYYMLNFVNSINKDQIEKEIKKHSMDYVTAYNSITKYPNDWRGEFLKVRGTLVTYYPKRLATNVLNLEDAWEGVIADEQNEVAFYFICIDRPDRNLVTMKDEVTFEGVFMYNYQYKILQPKHKVIGVDYPTYRIVPVLIGKNIKKIIPKQGFSVRATGIAVIVIIVGFGLLSFILYFRTKKLDAKYNEKMLEYRRNKRKKDPNFQKKIKEVSKDGNVEEEQKTDTNNQTN